MNDRHATRHFGYVHDAVLRERAARTLEFDAAKIRAGGGHYQPITLGRGTIADMLERAEKAEFLLAILAQCAGSRFYAIHEAIYPGPIDTGNGVLVDGSEAARAARHDIIRKLFHD